MAQVALSIAGSALFGPIGGIVGGYIGGFVDGKLFGGGGSAQLANQVGPRINSLKVQSSAYGEFIPQVFGRMRVAGNVIWARDIREVEIRETSTSSGGGKGGGGGGSVSQTSIRYEYYATLAIAVAEGPIHEISRVWADSKLLTAENLQTATDNFEIFLGGENQAPSTIMESFEGAGKVPAYRGTAYVVIRDFPLANYGNRIPNFTFEIRRTVRTSGLEEMIRDITLIPGSGEFVYAREIVEKIQQATDANGNSVPTGKRTKMNMHNFDGRPNVNIAIEQMAEALPNLEWVSVVVNWFITSSDVGTAEIVPKVEFAASTANTSVQWEVAGLTRAGAQLVRTFPNGSPTYGGTPTDKSLVQLCKRLKALGYKVMLYPMPLVDTVNETPGETDKPWRGRLVPASTAEVTTFFTRTWGYNRFIRHYSQLSVGGDELADYIDAFVIGSELIGLTTFNSGGNTYPAVARLKTLCDAVKTDVGSAVKTVYAADWTEYHSDGTGYYHLDQLWNATSLDVVGIDAYFPITPDVPQVQITPALIKEYWEKGEGWDYFYSDAAARTGKTNYSGATYAWKNVEHWWNSTHYHFGNPANASGWTPKKKPIWFTEFGFPSVDGAANQPNVFVDPTSIESYYPRRSRKRVDFKAQRDALAASLEFFQARNAETGNANLVPRSFVWTWDARPYSYWPDLLSVWADGTNWQTGHWINGKIGLSSLAAIVADILHQVGLQPSQYDVSELTDLVEGYIISDRNDARALIEGLQACYFFDAVESGGVLKFVKRGKASALTIEDVELVPFDDAADIREIVEITRQHDIELPRDVDVVYINRPSGFLAGTQKAARQTVESRDVMTINAQLVLSDTEARQIADQALYASWVARTSYSFRLPPKYAFLEPTDVITITVNGVDHLMRLVETQLARAGMIEAKAVAEDISTYDFYSPPGEMPPAETPADLLPATTLHLLDLPAFPSDSDDAVGDLRLAVSGASDSWPGAAIYRSDDGGEYGGNSFVAINSTSSEAVIGLTLNALPDAMPQLFDTGSTLDVALTSGSLSGTTQLALLNGANAAVVGNEIIQFQTAELISPNVYRLLTLLRGRLGTEHETGNHVVQDRFILLDSAVLRQGMPINVIGLQKFYKSVTVGAPLAEAEEQAFTYRGIKFRPYSPVHVKGIRDLSGNLTITWIRRTRIAGEWRDYVDVPLGEESERYDVEIMDGTDVARTITALTSPIANYSAAEQIADFGIEQANLTLRLYQVSAVSGRSVRNIAEI